MNVWPRLVEIWHLHFWLRRTWLFHVEYVFLSFYRFNIYLITRPFFTLRESRITIINITRENQNSMRIYLWYRVQTTEMNLNWNDVLIGRSLSYIRVRFESYETTVLAKNVYIHIHRARFTGNGNTCRTSPTTRAFFAASMVCVLRLMRNIILLFSCMRARACVRVRRAAVNS